jgi:hypothetical protein
MARAGLLARNRKAASEWRNGFCDGSTPMVAGAGDPSA